MGVDDEYKMVSSQDDANEHLLERNIPMSRSTYKKRNMFASVAVGALVGAAVTFLFSVMFAPQGYSVSKQTEPSQAVDKAPVVVASSVSPSVVTTTVTQTANIPAATVTKSVNFLQDGKSQIDVDPAHQIPDGVMLDCGHNPAEARAKGCVFDVMMQDWMPRPCYDESLSERYLLAGNWTWWADAGASKSYTLDEMRKGEHSVIFVIQDYHKQHCIYAWEKATRALRNNWPLIDELLSYDHVMHCRHSTLSKESEGVGGVRAPTAYSRCALYKDWTGRLPGNSVSSIEKREAWAEY